MVKNHFFFGYHGNKRNEVEGIYKTIVNMEGINDVKTIVEPFCGSCAMSVYVSNQEPGKYKYVLNDNNKHLVELLTIAKSKTKLDELIEDLNNKVVGIDKEKYNAMMKEKTLLSWIISNTIYKIRPGLFPNDGHIKNNYDNFKNTDIVRFLRNEKVTITNTDGIDVMKKYKDVKTCLMLLDPPYIVSCNSMYANADVNVYQYLYNNKIENMKCKILLCLESMWIIKLLFQNNKISEEYNKTYEMTKKKTQHIIITN
jgi:site-specific DNA-adenine methylase